MQVAEKLWVNSRNDVARILPTVEGITISTRNRRYRGARFWDAEKAEEQLKKDGFKPFGGLLYELVNDADK